MHLGLLPDFLVPPTVQIPARPEEPSDDKWQKEVGVFLYWRMQQAAGQCPGETWQALQRFFRRH